MNFDEAVTAMKEGKKVRISSWKRDAYIILLDDEFFTPNDCIRELSYSQITATNWEVVEPKIVPLSEKSNSVGDMYNTYKTGKRFVKTYIEEDIKLALEELLAYFESGRIGPYTSLQEKIKEIFGSDLL